MVSDNTELDFGMARPVLVSGNQGLQAKGVGKSFNKRRVVRNVSLDLQRGEAVGLLGPNGAGKTTTFYMLAGLLPADEGQVFVDGRDVTGMPIFQRARLGMGYLPQESSIFRGLTVEQNIRAVLETLEDHDDERDATLDDLMAEFGITHLRNTPSVSLSGGERRRLEIARALAARPTFLLPLLPFDRLILRKTLLFPRIAIVLILQIFVMRLMNLVFAFQLEPQPLPTLIFFHLTQLFRFL